MLKSVLEYHQNCEPVEEQEQIEWENVLDLLAEAKSSYSMYKALETCQAYHQEREPTSPFEKNDWRLFLAEVKELMDETLTLTHVDELSAGIDDMKERAIAKTI